MDSTSVKLHPDGTGALKTWPTGHRQVPRRSNTKIHLVAADARNALIVSLSPGQAHNGTEGHKLLQRLGPQQKPMYLLMDRAYQGTQTRQMAQDLGYIPVVPPRRHRLVQWEYDRGLYKRRNEVERLFRRLRGFRWVFSSPAMRNWM